MRPIEFHSLTHSQSSTAQYILIDVEGGKICLALLNGSVKALLVFLRLFVHLGMTRKTQLTYSEKKYSLHWFYGARLYHAQVHAAVGPIQFIMFDSFADIFGTDNALRFYS